jgi:hypothetical protein
VQALGKGRIDFTADELAAYGRYCCNDSDMTYKLFSRQAELIPPTEAKLIDLTVRMFTRPLLRLNRSVLDKHLAAVKVKKAKLMEAIETDKTVLMSNPKLAELLTALGVEPPQKISPTTNKPRPTMPSPPCSNMKTRACSRWWPRGLG